ncbi:MAG: DUF4340 domain-containing protein [Acetobacteraceae bacterium]|nr:DUF4340 domain-containing protein [Acetobacteraceae bacterium]
MTRGGTTYTGIAAAALMIALIGVISWTGKWPVSPWLIRSSADPKGILELPVALTTRIEINAGQKQVVVLERRPGGGWSVNGDETGPATAQHVDTALRLLNVSKPFRTLNPDDYTTAQVAEFGLEPPRMRISAYAADGKAHTVTFGEATPAQNAQYVRVIGDPNLYLLQRYVGVEWQVALDMLERTASKQAASEGATAGPQSPLLPVSIAAVSAVEIVENGVLTRFERDPAGDWFHHFGQHLHGPGGIVHKADPRLAPLIASELTALERVPVEGEIARQPNEDVLAQFGLEHPSSILLLYTRDSSDPVARISFGKMAEGDLDRYAQVQETEELVVVPGHATDHITKLLQLAGVRS